MLIETIKRRVINRKALIAILLVCLTGVADVFVFFAPKDFVLFDFVLWCICGIVSAVIIVPLIYSIPSPVKNIIACAALRGLFGTYLIMFLAFLCMIISNELRLAFIYSEFNFNLHFIFAAIAIASIFIPLYMFGIFTHEDGFIGFDGGYFGIIFTITIIVSFLIAELVERSVRCATFNNYSANGQKKSR